MMMMNTMSTTRESRGGRHEEEGGDHHEEEGAGSMMIEMTDDRPLEDVQEVVLVVEAEEVDVVADLLAAEVLAEVWTIWIWTTLMNAHCGEDELPPEHVAEAVPPEVESEAVHAAEAVAVAVLVNVHQLDALRMIWR